MKKSELQFERVSFAAASSGAHACTDGSVIYGAAWEDQKVEVFPRSREIRVAIGRLSERGHPRVSSTRARLSLGRRFVGWGDVGNRRARPLRGAPRELPKTFRMRTGAPTEDSSRSSVTPAVRTRSSSPRTTTWSRSTVQHLRVSPRAIARVSEHELWGDDGGRAVIIDRSENASRSRAVSQHRRNGVDAGR